MKIFLTLLIPVLLLVAAHGADAAVTANSLVKLDCSSGAAVDHPCKAVYYYGSDGKRHAFPNDKVYFTWYTDFSSVQIVSSDVMASFPLGTNVTYRPGVKLVKITTDPKVYAVSLGGVLRWVTSEALASSLYGADWNTKIHDVPDAFFINYTLGTNIVSTSDYTPIAETVASRTINVDKKLVQFLDKFSLWNNGTQLRGAIIAQSKVYVELGMDATLGPGAVGPPLEQKDFDNLVKAGANLVLFSCPGLFDDRSPYTLNKGVQDNLDRIIAMAEKADLFVVIAFRSGPGRSEFTLSRDQADTWFPKSYINDDVWKLTAAQDAYAAQWRYTADRYKNNPVVVGYELMVEPNGDDLTPVPFEPGSFEPYDWNLLHKKISKAIREVDIETPIIIGGKNYSGVQSLPSLMPNEDNRTVYAVHQYDPADYTHQWPKADGSFQYQYPGKFDTDSDGKAEDINKGWINNFLKPVDAFKNKYGAPVAATEYGILRFVPAADVFLNDHLELLESRGMNHAIWEWGSSYTPDTNNWNPFMFRFGPDINNATETSSKQFDVVKTNWKKNVARPSNFR